MPNVIKKPVKISEDHFLLQIEFPDASFMPGQFLNIRVCNQTDPLLRRPFSIHNCEGGIIEIIFKVVGNATMLLRDTLQPGDIDILAPLGQGFSLINGGNVLLVGGGVGNAPLYYLARNLKNRGNRIVYLYGSKSSRFVYLKERYREISDTFLLATDDGSDGVKGFVTDIIDDIVSRESFDIIYTCGPARMMSTIVKKLQENPVQVEVSVENYFGCGFGVCSGCAIETRNGLKHACVDGPVFDGKMILWDSTNEFL